VSEYRTVFRPEAQAELRKIPRDIALRILAKLAELETDPLGFGTTALVSQPERRRLRVGDYRVVYTIDNGELWFGWCTSGIAQASTTPEFGPIRPRQCGTDPAREHGKSRVLPYSTPMAARLTESPTHSDESITR